MIEKVTLCGFAGFAYTSSPETAVSTLGALALSRLHAQEAVGPLRTAVRLQPNDAIARNLMRRRSKRPVA